MPTNYVALALVVTGLALAAIICRSLAQPITRALVVWLSAAAFHFITAGDPIITIFGTALIVFALAPADPAERIGFFLIVVPALPDSLQWVMTAPGIETLGVVDHYKLSVVILLLPLCFRKEVRTQPISASELGLLLYCLITATVSGSATNLTSGIRFLLLNQILVLMIPFVAIVRTIRTARDISTVLNGWVIASIILASMTLVATMKQWDFYRLYETFSVFNQTIYRGDLLRISITTTSHSLSYHLAVAVLIVEHFRKQGSLSFLSALTIQALFLSAMFFSQSRGAAAGLAVGFLVMLIIRIQSTELRRTCYGLFAIGCLAGGAYLIFADQTANDPYGTFKYRQDLLVTALNYIWDNPLGDFNALTSPSFAHLLQGQGIIDITNLYLLVMLYYGIPSAIILFGVIARSSG